MNELANRIFETRDAGEFEALALEVFRYQSKENPVYAEYLSGLGVDPGDVVTMDRIPFLPIGFFRDRKVITGKHEATLVFESSGTTGQVPSRHHLVDPALYERSFLKTFSAAYGDPSGWCILALLPSYLERENSSLVYMADRLIGMSGHPESGFYLDDLRGLTELLIKRSEDERPTLLMGVSFALLDLAERHPVQLAGHITVMETGGMKGRRKEMIREELHARLKSAFRINNIHAEYGMTEMLSQAYSPGDSLFIPPPWMKVMIRDTYDPLTLLTEGRAGGINIIDLANIHSCAFIETGDLGVVYPDGRFEVRGRFDHAEVRGCNLMV